MLQRWFKIGFNRASRIMDQLYPDDKEKICADGSPSYAAETGFGYIHIKEILDLLKEQKYPGNVIVELYDYSPEHMLEGIGESVSWVAGVLRE